MKNDNRRQISISPGKVNKIQMKGNFPNYRYFAHLWSSQTNILWETISWVNDPVYLMCVPYYVHVIARNKELVWIILLKLEIHCIPSYSHRQKCFVLVMWQGNLKISMTISLLIFSLPGKRTFVDVLKQLQYHKIYCSQSFF